MDVEGEIDSETEGEGEMEADVLYDGDTDDEKLTELLGD